MGIIVNDITKIGDIEITATYEKIVSTDITGDLMSIKSLIYSSKNSSYHNKEKIRSSKHEASITKTERESKYLDELAYIKLKEKYNDTIDVLVDPIAEKPVLDARTASDTNISGTVTEIDGTVVKIYVDNEEICESIVANNSFTHAHALVVGQVIKAHTFAFNKKISEFSDEITVTA